MDDHAGVEVAAYYWHFVDVVWIALFLTIFVIR
jgi:cytochrome c oxidase subunit 3